MQPSWARDILPLLLLLGRLPFIVRYVLCKAKRSAYFARPGLGQSPSSRTKRTHLSEVTRELVAFRGCSAEPDWGITNGKSRVLPRKNTESWCPSDRGIVSLFF